MTARLVQAIHLNLQVLDFDAFLRKEAKAKNMDFLREFSNTPDLLLTQDKRPFHVVTYFLMHCLSQTAVYAKWLKDLKSCFPCVDRAMETDFRKITADFFQSLQKETDFHYKKMPFATILMNPGKEPFLHLYLKFTAFVLTKQSSHDERMIIRSLKSHQTVGGTIKANIAALIQSQSEVALIKSHLLSIIADYRKNYIQCSRERNEEQTALEHIVAESGSAFSEQDNSEDTCGAYMRQIMELRSKLPLRTAELLSQLETDLKFGEKRAHLLTTCSNTDVVSHIRGWELVGRKVASDICKDDLITTLCRKNSSADSLVQKTDSDIAVIVREMEAKRLQKREDSLSMRQKILTSDSMRMAKKRIADQMGLHLWLNLDLTPMPIPPDGTRKWREREKQRHQLRQVPAGTVTANEVIPEQPPSPLTPNHNDSLHNFSLINATVEMSRLSMLELSTMTPDFLLDTSAHCP